MRDESLLTSWSCGPPPPLQKILSLSEHALRTGARSFWRTSRARTRLSCSSVQLSEEGGGRVGWSADSPRTQIKTRLLYIPMCPDRVYPWKHVRNDFARGSFLIITCERRPRKRRGTWNVGVNKQGSVSLQEAAAARCCVDSKSAWPPRTCSSLKTDDEDEGWFSVWGLPPFSHACPHPACDRDEEEEAQDVGVGCRSSSRRSPEMIERCFTSLQL